MRSPSLPAFRPRRVLALAGVVSLIGGLLMLPGLAHPGRAVASARPAAASGCTGSGTTVTGPQLWDPIGDGKAARPTASCVTVDQTSSLVNQMVQVTWANFTPSANAPYGPSSTLYPVMIAECVGTNPASSADCYGATNGGVTGGSGPFGPMNTAYALTTPDGTGQADIEIDTTAENQFLGCDQKHACSLVVVPAQGGDVLASPPNCADHSQDNVFAIGQLDFGATFNTCSWADRIVIPLSFAPTPSVCSFKHSAFSAAGSPMLDRAMASWVAHLCLGPRGMSIQYNPEVAEPLAVQEVASGAADVALTTEPASAQQIVTQRHYLYAPVAVSAVSIAYWVDSPTTGLPVTTLKLDQRLVVKLLTQSYNFQNEGVPCGAPPPPVGIGCDNAVDGNPQTLFADPEFQQLNPAVQPVSGLGAAFQVPTVESGQSDMTWTVTRWIAANADAAAFLKGQFDPWGMHVNTDYENTPYPTNAFAAQDSYPVIQHRYSPLFPLSLVSSYQVENWEPGTSWEKDQTGNFPKDPIQPPGQRALFAILDQADAAAFRFPVAEIPNTAGEYVQPTRSAMAAALTGHERRRQRHPAGEPGQQQQGGLPADDGDLRDGAHQRHQAQAGGGDRPVPRLRRRGRPERGRAARAASAGLSAAAGQLGRQDAQGRRRGAEPDRCHPHARRHNQSRDRDRDRLRLVVPDPVALDQPGRFCVAAGGQPGGRRAADQHGAAGPRVAGHHYPVRPARAADPRRARGPGRLVLAARRRPRRGRRQAAPPAPGRCRVGPQGTTPRRIEEEVMTPKWRARAAALLGAGTAVLLASMVPMPAGASSFVAISGSGSSWASVAIDLWSQRRPVQRHRGQLQPGRLGGRARRLHGQPGRLRRLGPAVPQRPGQAGRHRSRAPVPGVLLRTGHRGRHRVHLPHPGGQPPDHEPAAGPEDDLRNLHRADQELGRQADHPASTVPSCRTCRSRRSSVPTGPARRTSSRCGCPAFSRRSGTAFCDQVHQGITPPCGQTEFYPQFGSAKAENGSNNVITYITSSFGNGSIGYDEYAYALNAHYPGGAGAQPGRLLRRPDRAKRGRGAHQGRDQQPEEQPELPAAEPQQAVRFTDPRNYPISSYSYLIVPREGTTEPTNFTNAKGATLSTWINFMLCGGQQQMKQLGYSPLPKNLVQGGLIQNGKIPGHVRVPSINTLTNCNNPTMQNGQNILLNDRPVPVAVPEAGRAAELRGEEREGRGHRRERQLGGPEGDQLGQRGQHRHHHAGTGTGTGTTTASATGPVTGVVVNLAGDHSNQAALGALTAFGIVLAVALPPGLAAWLRRRRGQARG